MTKTSGKTRVITYFVDVVEKLVDRLVERRKQLKGRNRRVVVKSGTKAALILRNAEED